MDGFLSSNWRDGLAIFGVTLSLLQSLVLLREWLYGKEKGKRGRLRLGYLEEVLESPESSPEDKRVIRIAFAISCGVVAAFSIASSFITSGDGCLAEMVRLWAPMVIAFIALFHEAGGLYVITRYLSSKVEGEYYGRLGLALGACLIALFILSCLVVSSYEKYMGSWFSRLILYYSGAYLFVFLIVTITEVVYQVDEWKESKKKRQKRALW